MKSTVNSAPKRISFPFFGLIGALVFFACGAENPVPDSEYRALNALDDQRPDLARAAAEAGLESHGERVPLLRIAAEAWGTGNLQSPTRVADFATRYLALMPHDQEMRLRLAGAYFLLGQWSRAAAEAAKIPDESGALVIQAKAVAEFDLDASRKLAERLGEKPADDAAAHGTAAAIFIQLGDPSLARQHAQIALAADPLDKTSLYILGRLLLRDRQKELARQYLERHQHLVSLTLEPPLDGPELEVVLESLDPLIRQSSVELRLLRLRFGGRGAEDAAAMKDELRSLADLAVESGLGVEIGGRAESMGERSLARTIFAQVIEGEESTSGGGAGSQAERARSAAWRRATHGLAWLEFRDGEVAKAQERLEKAIAIAPWAASFHALLGTIALHNGDEVMAALHLGEAVQRAPWKAAERLDLARLLIARGELEKAIDVARRAPEPTEALTRFLARHRQES